MRILITVRDTMEISAGITRMAIRSAIGLLVGLRRARRPSPPGLRPATTTPPEGRSGPIECPAQFGTPRIKSMRGLSSSRVRQERTIDLVAALPHDPAVACWGHLTLTVPFACGLSAFYGELACPIACHPALRSVLQRQVPTSAYDWSRDFVEMPIAKAPTDPSLSFTCIF
jgi:hypothetical protein